MLLLIDNYDSFTYNLYHYLGEIGADVEVRRNDALSADAALALKPKAIVLSPGPCSPNEAGICLELVTKAVNQNIPLLGVCLGHQAIGQAFGGKVVRAPQPIHGKTDQVTCKNKGIFSNIPTPFTGTRYHSLVVDRESLPAELEITAENGEGLIMGMQHKSKPVFGVQFHPESIASEHGHAMLKNFLSVA
jgi:anthranilate synthase/aminodeoxychorismate synthase-like glutamine amidotransferase